MVPFQPTRAALDAVFNAKEKTVQELLDQKQDSSERYSVRGEILEVRGL